ncbi:uncharacterized protein EDB93DRAFT_1106181 [Suillus bovinus]|uniref:uncharacterized protein n=1 Tax=Suillus bovinus TaxID=48563 RepID=UPI001B85BFEF|nr:uncharacterized protein EDB93DRAFT_1106181 [Suillus bovinus]KAG2139211.1 hypothetical protein EDB93DRAFT_1106181 [Suillus bovinus]
MYLLKLVLPQSGSLRFSPQFSHQPEPDQKMVLGSRSSPTVLFWFGLAKPFQTIIDFDFDFDCDNFGLHIKLLSSGFALLVNQATFSLFEESCVVKARIILMEASAPEQTTAQPITCHATCAYVDLLHVDSTLDGELHVLHAAFIAKNCTVLTSYFHVPPGTSASSAATDAEMGM